MKIDLSPLADHHRLLFEIPLKPLQGSRFQPTGFPNLGPAVFQTPQGTSLLVESAQSMANRLEMTCWDEARQDLKPELAGLSHVRVLRKEEFLTDSILESHRLNSPYILEGKAPFVGDLKKELGTSADGPVDRHKLAKALLKFDVCSLLHGVFLEKISGRLRLARALSAFIEADGVRTAASGGVKNDHVNPSGVAKDGFGNVPFARDEFTAENITLFVNIDLAQMRGYGLGEAAERLLLLLALYKLRMLTENGLRLRTACDFCLASSEIAASVPTAFVLPPAAALKEALPPAIAACKAKMTVTEVSFDKNFKKETKRKE